MTCFLTDWSDGGTAGLGDLKDEEPSRELDWTVHRQASQELFWEW